MAETQERKRELIRDEYVGPGQRRVFYENGVFLGEYVMDVDGFWYFWPDQSKGGHWGPDVLRALADKIDEMDKPWRDQINKELAEVEAKKCNDCGQIRTSRCSDTFCTWPPSGS